MKEALHKSRIPASRLFVIKRLVEKYFDPEWHAHSEYQLFVVLEGTGTRFIGDNIHSFRPGELILTGPHLPHVWRSDDSYFRKNSSRKTDGIVIYLDENFLGNSIVEKLEMAPLRKLFEKAMRGLEFYGPQKPVVIDMMKELIAMDGIRSVIRLLEILEMLAASKEYHYLSSKPFESFHPTEADRLNTVYEYAFNNFRKKIYLDEIARMVNMTPTSFCRYFARRNNKSFSRFIAELRIKNACELLISSDRSIASICYDCGFNTLSNFNRQFRGIMGQQPYEYRKEMMSL